jgi:OmpA-OmpF porin, OOP family
MCSKFNYFIFMCCISLSSLLLPLVFLSAQEEEQKEEDHPVKKVVMEDCPYFPGIESYFLNNVDDKDFEYYNFYNGSKNIEIAGRKWTKNYLVKDTLNSLTEKQIMSHYADEVKSKNGKVLFNDICEDEECDFRKGYLLLTGVLKFGDSEIWLEVTAYNNGANYDLICIEKGEMVQDISSAGILKKLKEEGNMNLFIKFDSGKSVILPESNTILDELKKMMIANSDLIISIEGHTDNKGSRMARQELSEARAKAVMDALISRGVDAKRMSSLGWGDSKPLNDNDNDENKARNNRIEIVKK